MTCGLVCALVLIVASRANSSKTKENAYFEIRSKRGAGRLGDLAVTGLRAAKTLLKGAVQTRYKSYDTREFTKIGNLQTASTDFYAIRPKLIQQIKLDSGGYVRVGAIGDRNIILRSNGPSGHPTIELKKSGTHGVQDSPTVEIITYKKQFDWK